MKSTIFALTALVLAPLPAIRAASVAPEGSLQPIHNDTVWQDTDGNELRAQGGSMMKLGDTYYWYGMDDSRRTCKDGIAIKCYTSRDLSRWKFENTIFTSKDSTLNRMDVVYSPAIKKYVMISKHMRDKKGVGISICATPAGTFEWQGWAALPDSTGGGDQSVFIDDDGKGYITYTPWRKDSVNANLCIAELTPDFLKVGCVVCEVKNTHMEAPAIFKRNGKYYWLGSQVWWWWSSATSWSMADKLEGPWAPFKKMEARRPAAHPLARQMLGDSYNSQHDFVVEVKGTAGSFFMYCGDRYSNHTCFGVGYNVWLPLQFNGDVPVLDWHQTWYVNAAQGTWSATKEDVR